jgi:hypothetical protein
MMRRAVTLFLVLTCALVSACGDDSSTPTNPSQPGALVISPQTDFLTIGTVLTLQAAVTDSSGASRVVAADWSVEDGRVAGIDRSGRLTALGSGTTSVRAVFEQRTATLAIRVAPDYSGTWSGRARVTACSHPTPSVCQVEFAVGSQFVTRVMLSQSRDQVVGTLYVPYPAALSTVPPLVVDGTLSGRIEVGGGLPMAGVLVGPTPTSPAVGAIADWRTEIDTTQPILRGSYREAITSPTTSSISWELIGLTRGT